MSNKVPDMLVFHYGQGWLVFDNLFVCSEIQSSFDAKCG